MTYTEQARKLIALGWKLDPHANLYERLAGKVWFEEDDDTGYTLAEAMALEAEREALLDSVTGQA